MHRPMRQLVGGETSLDSWAEGCARAVRAYFQAPGGNATETGRAPLSVAGRPHSEEHMRVRRTTKLLVEPPSMATGDIAFNLIVFFLVCASTAPDSGRRQNIPSSETAKHDQKTEHIEIQLTRTTMMLNGDPMPPRDLLPRLKGMLAGKTRPAERVVVVKSRPDVPYHHWIDATALIEAAGGIITIQREEQREVRIGD